MTAAKALAAFLTPIVLALLAKIAANAGVDLPVEPSAVEAVITAVVSAVIVYFARNKQVPPPA